MRQQQFPVICPAQSVKRFWNDPFNYPVETSSATIAATGGFLLVCVAQSHASTLAEKKAANHLVLQLLSKSLEQVLRVLSTRSRDSVESFILDTKSMTNTLIMQIALHLCLCAHHWMQHLK